MHMHSSRLERYLLRSMGGILLDDAGCRGEVGVRHSPVNHRQLSLSPYISIYRAFTLPHGHSPTGMWSTLKTGSVIHYDIGACSLGNVIVGAVSPSVLCAVAFGDDQATLLQWLQAEHPKDQVVRGGQGVDRLLEKIVSQVDSGTPFKVQTQQAGTPFQRRVWEAIQSIPPGSTRSYSQLATQIGRPTATRAVARACGANRIPIVIPCHRVVGSDGSLTGFRWGVERKNKLLALEARSVIATIVN